MQKQRNRNFDIWKGLASIFVVMFHVCPDSIKSVLGVPLFRWMVPVFFAIAGFFFRRNDCSYCLKKAKHIFTITLWATLFYIAFVTIFHLIQGDLSAFFSMSMKPLKLLALVFLNIPTYFPVHLWYLYAMLYVYLVYAVMIRLKLTRFNRLICILCIIAACAVTYGLHFVLGMDLDNKFSRNFLLQGIPFFLLGMWIYQAVKDADEYRRQRLGRIGWYLVITGELLLIAECYVLDVQYLIPVGVYPMVIGILFLSQNDHTGDRFRILEKLGKDYSLMLYVLHFAFRIVLNVFYDRYLSGCSIGIDILWFIGTSIVAILGSILIAMLLDLIKGRLKNMHSALPSA